MPVIVTEELKRNFDASILQWATAMFSEETRTNFQRARCFDDKFSTEVLSVLMRQPAENMEILARVVPLGVFWKGPRDKIRHDQLPEPEKEAVNRFRANFEEEGRKHYDDHLRLISRLRTNSPEFQAACKAGNRLVKGIAADWGWKIALAAPGEWGIIRTGNGLRTVISLKLGKNMELFYTVGMSSADAGRSLCFRNNYLGVLGLGSGGWAVPTLDSFPEKMKGACEFARWHADQYDGMLLGLTGVRLA